MLPKTAATKTRKRQQHDDEPEYLPFSSLSREEMIRLAHASESDRQAATIPLSQVSAQDVLRIEPMTVLEHAAAVLFLALGVPTTIPLFTFLWGRLVLGNVTLAFQVLIILLVPLAVIPQEFVPSRLQSRMAVIVAKYFSFRLISEERSPPPADSGPSQILVAPPHGVFPYGSVVSVLAWPVYSGQHVMGLTSTSVLRLPIFKQILRGIGLIDASRSSARRALETHTIGISTGGLREVFETNSVRECILLKDRIGLIKLAIRTGADLVPCYVFGNTQLLSCWAGEGVPFARDLLEAVSRKFGFALVLFHGWFGLPIPRRVPILVVKGKAIPTKHLQTEDPTFEQITKVQQELISEIQTLFDRYKPWYGWEKKRLIIK